MSSCGPHTTLEPIYDYANATVDVSVDVEGEGFTTGWHLSVAFQPNNDVPFAVIQIQRDDCPDDHDYTHGQITIQGDLLHGEDSIEVTQFSYETVNECLIEPCSDCWDGATEATVSGIVIVDASQSRYRMVFEELHIEIIPTEPPVDGIAIHSVTLNGTYTARGRQ